jgi:hypothetical protein
VVFLLSMRDTSEIGCYGESHDEKVHQHVRRGCGCGRGLLHRHGVGSVPVQAQAQHRVQPAHEFWLVIRPGESFAEAVRVAALTPGGGRVATAISEMLKQVEAGQVVYVPQGTRRGITSVPATVAELRTALSAARSLDARHVEAQRAVAALPIAPDTLPPIRGNGCNPVKQGGVTVDTTWCDLPLELEAEACDPEGCEGVDRLNASVQTNPGADGSSSPYTVSNTVTTGYPPVFTDVHINWNTLCYSNGQECGHGTTGNVTLPDSDRMSPTSDVPVWGDKISHSYYLWALLIPNGQNYADDALTGTATCESESQGNQCFYPTG